MCNSKIEHKKKRLERYIQINKEDSNNHCSYIDRLSDSEKKQRGKYNPIAKLKNIRHNKLFELK
jgi:hypothetical protein